MKNIINFKRKKWDNDNIENARLSWFLYVPMFSEKFSRLNSEDILEYHFIVLISCMNSSRFIRISFCMKRNLMCTRFAKITSYVEQIGRQLKTRIIEHRNRIHGTQPHITNHQLGKRTTSSIGKILQFWTRNPSHRKIDVIDATYQETDTWPQLIDRLGRAFQGLLSNCRRTINFGALLLLTIISVHSLLH